MRISLFFMKEHSEVESNGMQHDHMSNMRALVSSENRKKKKKHGNALFCVILWMLEVQV